MLPPVDRPEMGCERLHPVLVVPDIAATVDFYVNKLGFHQGFIWADPPTYAGVNLGDVSIHLALGKANPSGCSINFDVDNADEFFEFHKRMGVEVVEPPADREYGLRDYAVRDLNGYVICFGHFIYSHPPLKIERVDVPLRLEKRLASLLYDLADHKHMSVNSCIEEMMLHSFEPLGEGVASPHTKTTLRYIQELKQKHGIDYDCHGSYRFVE